MKRRTWILAGLASVAVVFGAMLVAHGAGEPPPLWPFSAGTTAKASEVNFNFSALAGQITANVPWRTRLDYNSKQQGTTDPTVLKWTSLRTFGTFTKHLADTDVVVDLDTDILVNGVSAQFQLRIDDQNDGQANSGMLVRVTTGSVPVNDSASTKALFKGLSAGPHTVTLWVRSLDGPSTAVSENDASVDRAVFIEESPSR